MLYLEKREAYEKKMLDIVRQAQDEGTTPYIIAMRHNERNRADIEDFVRRHGEEPKETIEALTAQAAIIHEQNVEAKQASGVPDYIVAENAVLQDYALKEFNGDPDYFIDPGTLGSIFSGAKNAITNINAKRAENGKPPLLAGKKKKALFYKAQEAQKVAQTVPATTQAPPKTGGFKTVVNPNSGNVYVEDPEDGTQTPVTDGPYPANQKTELGQILQGIIGGVREGETKKAMKDYLPYIIGAAVLIFIIARKTK